MSITSAEVAADFKDALQDLKTNSRPEISNLTIIAKENTEHAQAISGELEKHIRTTRPDWKLPALYVLDSIVKNVGTPYTVYLGRNLYRTFMDAYMVMDPANRRAMDGLLKTWKQPVPDSMDTRPVFAPEVTRDIENTLIKIRTHTVQAQQTLPQRPHGLPPRPTANPMANGPWRNTPTPPQGHPRFAVPNDPRLRQNVAQPNPYGSPAPHQFTTPTPQPFPMGPPLGELESVQADVAQLIASLAPSDMKRQSLLDLQTLLNNQSLPNVPPLTSQQLQAIRAQIQALTPSPAPAMPQYAPPVPNLPQPFLQTPPQNAPPSFPPAGAALNLAQILAAAQARPVVPQSSTPVNAPPAVNLADILRQVSVPAQSSTTTAAMPFFPPPSFPPVPPPVVQPTPPPAPTPTNNLAQLLASLPKPASAQAPQPPSLPLGLPTGGPATATPDWLLNALKGLPQSASGAAFPPQVPASSTPMARQASGATNTTERVEMTSASLKQPRFHLINKLYGARPNVCATCGRRFASTPEGKERKARHLDWHFDVRDSTANRSGVHRSWYIDEREWIDYKDFDESSPPDAAQSTESAAAPKEDPKEKYVRVPSDISKRVPCPICQEKFDTNVRWHQAANDFVWMDAVEIKGRIYHATCWEEFQKGASIPAPTTPDSVLGKRKAERDSPASGKKIRAF
ncbi:hypothetical protein M011DRAFT_481210 [Sporormia fimetaria CBS 119925]|uniref:CID domain-containing protein n=1 Tax=Sporormia fimetaria CBS 119925 TaxID=1340428 RepID=A0A6A6UZI7_9PLEO|nr:hypothetical protein M011DRAFT_481210 [Sporormia fimetaria CBS 119925]